MSAPYFMRRTNVGYLAPDDDRALKALLRVPIGSVVKVEIPALAEAGRRRTLSQNALYWKWLSEAIKAVATETGNDTDDLHEFFKHKFLTPQIIEVRGETIQRWTTTKMTTAEMAEFTDKVYAWIVGELGIILPMPQDLGRST